MNPIHEANRQSWDAKADFWRQLRDRDQLWRQCTEQPSVAFQGQALELIQQYMPTLADKQVCVIGSGDNYAAFALAGLGAAVTSVDISENQLAVARQRAQILDLTLTFVRADAADLAPLATESFDLVFSSNGFYVWIADVPSVFREIHRILCSRGHYIFYDVHPFQRPWDREEKQRLAMSKSYWEIGPNQDEGDSHYEFHYTIADFLNALADSGLRLCKLLESPPSDARYWQDFSYESGTDTDLTDWRNNPRAGLPAWLTVAAQKA
ncbi:MAG: class I SAM-dependent methyltransferase [Caldilineaceae bacterium]|nr:class I SAM-dependent methyltransferase [Caldilineaceae bacterium]MCB0124086.1 class I SAM-dependent methyltransferase [Caldilineaceae bacterium]